MSTPELSGAIWRKSRHSGANEGECVEVAVTTERLVAARDSKNPSGPVLCFAPREWRAFCTGIKYGTHDSVARAQVLRAVPEGARLGSHLPRANPG